MIQLKKMKKEQVLHHVMERNESEERRKMERFMAAQQLEMERERRIEEAKRREQEARQRKGYEKNSKIAHKVEEAYKQMMDWQNELERREQAAADNLKKQQQILAEKLEVKRELQRLKQESAQLKQKRKDLKESLKQEEQLQKWTSMSQKMDAFKY